MRLKICLWVIVASLLPIVSFAQDQDKSLVRELYVKSGMEEQFGQLPPYLQANLDQVANESAQAQKLPLSFLTAMRASIPVAFAPEKIKEAVLAELSEKLTPQDIKEILQWLDSPLGKKCTQLEEAASTPEAQAEMPQFVAHLKEVPPTPERLEALRELDSATKGTDIAVETALQTGFAVVFAVNSTLPKERQSSPDTVLLEMEKSRPAIEAEVKSLILTNHLYTYKTLTEAEIGRYTDFSKSAIGLKYSTAGIAAIRKVFLECAVKWGKLIGNAIQELKGGSEA